jgi:hypothetical protein
VHGPLKHSTTPRFWKRYRSLSREVQSLADDKFALLKTDPDHPSLHLKKVGRFWSCRVGLHYRAVGTDGPEGIVWFWIGSHAEYDKLLN